MTERTRIEELERLLREAELRAELADRQRLEERQRAEREEQRAETAEEQTRRTTLDEYIAACHGLVFSKFAVETEKSLTSKGSITNPRNKLCPTSLQPWSDFLEQQRIASGVLYDAFPTETRLFESRNFLSGLGHRISQRPIANEKDLEYFLHNSVEDPVRSILHQLKEVAEIQAVYGIGGGIIFENHLNAISDVSPEVVDRESALLPSTPDQKWPSNQLRPDQICVYRSEDGQPAKRSMVYVCEYKAPHKLTAQHLRAGLRPMDMYKEVVNRKTVPTSADPEGRFQYHAERLTAAAVSQTYHYMIEGGLNFGLLTTGEAIVILMIDWDNPQTLYYHLAEPGPEVSAHPHNFHSCTAVGQYLAFTLIALSRHGQSSSMVRRSAGKSPYPFRHPRRKPDCPDEPSNQPTRRDSPEPSDDESRGKLPDTPSPAERRSGGGGRGLAQRSQRIQARQTRDAPSSQRAEHAIQYCTQKCLAELLEESLDNGVTPLADGGSRGVLFRVTLLTYGYTFVGKGTVRAFIKDLEHEAAVYERLEPAQGVSIPVFLGTVDLRAMNKIYYYDHRVYIVHLMFLSWGGYKLDDVRIAHGLGKRLAGQTLQSLRSMHSQGVVHNDVRGANMLFNPETNRIMVIDFERAELVQPPRRALAQLVPNKRAWSYEIPDKMTKRDENSCRYQGRVDVGSDILMARSAFSELNWYTSK
ncbi:protein kinase [Metarhizium robertsii]|uniref:EKC/KEOPS complex subunit BUD32 n=1 Tax=Metarhizium robertsii TaxID=568076 RepID=A0A014P222_9HYPO|nr:protein kinase [Metarhizium robertsii]